MEWIVFVLSPMFGIWIIYSSVAMLRQDARIRRLEKAHDFEAQWEPGWSLEGGPDDLAHGFNEGGEVGPPTGRPQPPWERDD